MQIKTNNSTCPCTSFSENLEKTVFLFDGEIAVLGETVQLLTDDGFTLCEHNVSDYLKTNFGPGFLELLRVIPPVEPVPDLISIKSGKIAELAQVCNTAITAGCDVTLSDGTKGHISMSDEDQINLMSAIGDVQQGAAGTPYHLNGALCRIYLAVDIGIIAVAAKRHKLYHTTYCNHLNVWVRRSTSVEEVEAITYGAALPDDLAANMAEVLGHVG